MKGVPMPNLRFIPVAAALAVSGAALSVAPMASAKGGDGVKVGGVCSQNSTSKLKLKHEDRGIEVEFEVDQNRNGVPWKVTLRRNGALVASKSAITRGPSGSFSVDRTIAGAGGKFVAVATRSGERCSATASI
jgi:hypothetical protein